MSQGGNMRLFSVALVAKFKQETIVETHDKFAMHVTCMLVLLYGFGRPVATESHSTVDPRHTARRLPQATRSRLQI